jgi:uncharacterized protein
VWFYGPVANALGILAGGCFGLLIRSYLPTRAVHASELGLGIATIALGTKMALQFENVVILVLSIGLGGALGATIEIEHRVESLARRIQARYLAQDNDRFAVGFVNTSILFCTGAMAIVGSIQSGVLHDHSVSYAKTVLDGLISVTLAAVYGPGVLLASVPVLVYQGGIALLARQMEFLSEPSLLNELTGVGGVLLMMIGISLSGLRKIPVGDFLPALALTIIFKLAWG